MLQFGVTNVTGVSINIPSLNREFIKIMGLNARSKIAMTNLRRTSAYTLIILALLVVLMGLGQAMIANLVVKGGEEVTHPISLVAEDRVLIQFSVAVISAVGEPSNTVHFSIVFPNGTVRDFGEVGKTSFSFVCDVEGEYTLHFVNNDAMVDKSVTLNYEIDHYIFGIPQMLFMALIIVLACVGGVFAFVILGRKP
ncbi:MAG: hypothetical protein FJ045_03135 [Crenarchaeota archaeon]|nr:hypothetical protein [Thermoproteota archaeon]